ncbi:MAG: HPr family phosphocarrier protein [Bacillota bacterium]
MTVVEQEFVVQLEQGLHARPAARFVQTAARFTSEITVTAGGVSVSAKGIMGVLRLGVRQGMSLHLRAEGADAPRAVEALGRLLSGADE